MIHVLSKSMFLFVETKVGHCGLGLGVGTPCVFSRDPQFSESSREYTERKSIPELKGAGPLQGKPKITMEWCECLFDGLKYVKYI